MNQEITAAEQDVEQGGRGLAKLNPAPRQAYEFVLKIDDAPGPFAMVKGTAQYDVINEQECGRIVPATGRAGRITSKEEVKLQKVSDNEYRGTVYLDLMQDEDYYGRGVCQWKFSGAGAMLKATGADGETRFLSFIEADRFVKGETETQHYADMGYPRESMDDYADYGEDAPEGFKPELREKLFSITLAAKEAQP
ncbi:hypothetical protein ABB28_16495 [Stenotrophomonas chelatiphaga]|jgi:hypothetical protein|uniref:Uncharacterized protein n=1 Tax=Stenotrophomonas chelatiphaga TaxID=517011 RepID=A0A0R0CMN4_9GAMM|nr:hypothetical protein [Stenotrophomonas chelatiphaga]KRG67586.1 hypothetical protein ABB28_16495 [Stenotrophomonas chelatiphaga]MCS4229603.1 hypothetical protein [Stenotrophomonas chelatiphaga]ROQ36845.1 hypothetical protein EDF77_3481 [Stenotrophomonas maltophilia]